ncbi:MAG TPA: hypothetical protein VGI12_03380 [Vicinamibacterales bacterium]|jgi:hypothetical protein
MKFVLSATACLGLAAATVSAQTTAAMSVGATVLPHCRVSVIDAPAAGQPPAVTASCGASSLHVLRASAGGRSLAPIVGRHARAGGDATFLVSRDMATDGRTVVVTLDF